MNEAQWEEFYRDLRRLVDDEEAARLRRAQEEASLQRLKAEALAWLLDVPSDNIESRVEECLLTGALARGDVEKWRRLLDMYPRGTVASNDDSTG